MIHERFRACVQVATGFLVTFAVASAVTADVPDRIESSDPQRSAPIWVSETAFKQGANLHWEWMTPGEEAELRQATDRLEELSIADQLAGLKATSDSCRRWSGMQRGSGVRSYDGFRSFAGEAVLGSVVAVKQGFRFGRVASLFQLEVEGEDRGTRPTDALFFLRHGQIEVFGQRHCAAMRVPGVAPKVGDRVLVLVPAPEGRADGPPLIDETRIFWQDDTGTLHTPIAVQNHFSGLALADVVMDLRNASATTKEAGHVR